jgi:hypothetical protein
MVDDRPEDTGPKTDPERPKRAPPTIDLEATDVSTEPQPTASTAPSEPVSEPPPAQTVPPPKPISPWIVAPMSGAVAAALVIGVGWILGWPAIQPVTVPPAPQINAAAIDDLTARVAGLETKTSKPAAPVTDPAAAARSETLEKSVASLRAELAAVRGQSEKLESAIAEVKAAPRGTDGVASSPDLSAIEGRMAGIENQLQAQRAEIAQQGSRIGEVKGDGKPADDLALRRVVAGALLDVLVRTGDPYPTALAAAKALAPQPDALKPLDQFADKGVPNANKLSTELLALVPKLLPAAQQDPATTGSGIVEKLQAGAAKLVKIERTDTAGKDRGAVVARVTAAALRNDSSEARRELKTLEPADRAAAQAWLDRADARDAALAASRQFAADAMAVLAKPVQ